MTMRKILKKTAFIGVSVIFALLLTILLIEWTADLEPAGSVMLNYSDEPVTELAEGDTKVPLTADLDEKATEIDEKKDFSAMWVASIINLDYPSKTGLTADELMKEADKILDECRDMGMTAVVLQVRPSGDALYSSSIFPWSEYLTGTQGKAPEKSFDPLSYWIEGAHKRGIELHAWLNPYRVTRKSTDLNLLSANNPARLHPEWVVEYEGSLYYNPGIPEVRQLIIDGVTEIVKNYDVDGIHYDDYFYPGKDFADSATYDKYKGSFKNISDWRRNNNDLLIKGTYTAVKLLDPSVEFGVSPFGIWANSSSTVLGSATSGLEANNVYYADSRKWVKSGWLDYICPQIYWNIGYSVADYETLLNWWCDVTEGTSVKLYVGHAAYRSADAEIDSPWYGVGEIKRQLIMNAENEAVDGSFFFRYGFFESYAPLRSFISEYYNGGSTDMPKSQEPGKALGITIGRPSSDITVNSGSYYVIGQCDPNKPLYFNGEKVKGVTKSGYFGVYVHLSGGINTLSFVQEGSILVRTITRSAGNYSTAPTPMAKAEIVSGSTYPNVYDVYIMPGEKITFRCSAPIGAKVTVTLAGTTYKLAPGTTKAPSGGGIYATSYAYTYKLGTNYKAGGIYTVGTPVYKMTYNGKTSTVTATGALKCLTKGAPYYATVTTDNAGLYTSSSTTGGPVATARLGMRDYITAVTSGGSWVRLASGYWIERVNVKRTVENTAFTAAVGTPVYQTGDKWDSIKLPVSEPTLAVGDYTGGVLTIKLFNTSGAPKVTLPKGALVGSCKSVYANGCASYTITAAGSETIDGWYIDYENGAVILHLKRRPSTQIGKLPLAGITIMLDAGHGGSDTGALGPLGEPFSEKHLALNITNKLKFELERLGAKVIMTRTDDSRVLLEERLDMNRKALPDLFLAIHLNALETTKNAGSVFGFGAWYRNELSAELAKSVSTSVCSELGRVKKGANKSNLYVCRGTWCPSAIIECGFICNPTEFEWLASDSGQTEIAGALSRAVMNYFS